MSRPDKRQRHKAKRQAKRLQARRRESISPLKRIADAPGDLECWMSKNFEQMGQAQIFIYKRAAGLTALACFLIDRGVVGLKDAWTQVNIERSHLEEAIETSADNNIAMTRVSLDAARAMIAGGARWAHDNGMRLPKDWLKAISIIGGVGDWASADISRFVMEFAGHPNDLRQRLIGEPFETYIKRPDIDFIFSDAAPYMDQRTGKYSNDESFDGDDDDVDSIPDVPVEEIEEFDKRLTTIAANLTEETTPLLVTQNDPPSPELLEAWRSMLTVAMMAGLLADAPDSPEFDPDDFADDLLEKASARIEEHRLPEYQRAMEQVSHILEANPEILKDAILKNAPGEAEE